MFLLRQTGTDITKLHTWAKFKNNAPEKSGNSLQALLTILCFPFNEKQLVSKTRHIWFYPRNFRTVASILGHANILIVEGEKINAVISKEQFVFGGLNDDFVVPISFWGGGGVAGWGLGTRERNRYNSTVFIGNGIFCKFQWDLVLSSRPECSFF
jgi:hypothetical protein